MILDSSFRAFHYSLFTLFSVHQSLYRLDNGMESTAIVTILTGDPISLHSCSLCFVSLTFFCILLNFSFSLSFLCLFSLYTSVFISVSSVVERKQSGSIYRRNHSLCTLYIFTQCYLRLER